VLARILSYSVVHQSMSIRRGLAGESARTGSLHTPAHFAYWLLSRRFLPSRQSPCRWILQFAHAPQIRSAIPFQAESLRWDIGDRALCPLNIWILDH